MNSPRTFLYMCVMFLIGGSMQRTEDPGSFRLCFWMDIAICRPPGCLAAQIVIVDVCMGCTCKTSSFKTKLLRLSVLSGTALVWGLC